MNKNITSDYESHTKDELLTEADLRGVTVKTSDSKADIIAAIQLSDEHESPAQPPHPLPPLVASNIPQVAVPEVSAESGIDACQFPKDDQFTDGVFEMGGEKYALCIHDADGYGNTHSLKNSLHSWQGKESDFNAKFKRA